MTKTEHKFTCEPFKLQHRMCMQGMHASIHDLCM